MSLRFAGKVAWGVGLLTFTGIFIGISACQRRDCPPYTPPCPGYASRNWQAVCQVANSILSALRWICPRPVNYFFPKATVLMPTHPVPNPYPRELKKIDWKLPLDCAWREESSASLKNVIVEPNEQVTSLHVAAGGGNALGIHRFIGLGADVKARDLRGQTPAYWAAYYGHAAALAQLKTYGAELDSVDKRGKSPLRAAVKYDNLAAVDVLAAFNVDLNRRDGRELPPLHLAAYLDHTQMFHKLICYGADRTLTDSTGRTAEEVFNQRWEEKYRNKWFFTRYFSNPTPPKLDLKPYTLDRLIQAKQPVR